MTLELTGLTPDFWMLYTSLHMELSEKSLKIILEEQREEYQRYLGIVSEDFKSQVQLIAESMQP